MLRESISSAGGRRDGILRTLLHKRKRRVQRYRNSRMPETRGAISAVIAFGMDATRHGKAMSVGILGDRSARCSPMDVVAAAIPVDISA